MPWRSNASPKVIPYLSENEFSHGSILKFRKSRTTIENHLPQITSSLAESVKKRKVFKTPICIDDTRVRGRHINRRKQLILEKRRFNLISKRSHKKRGIYTPRSIKRGLQMMQFLLRDVAQNTSDNATSRPQNKKAKMPFDFHAEQEVC